MVRGIIIPADNTAPLTAATFELLEHYQRAVDSWIEAVDIPDLGVTMYVNEGSRRRPTTTSSSATGRTDLGRVAAEGRRLFSRR